MQYESYISKEGLKNYYKKDQDKFVQVGFVRRTKRSINEFISLADLSKIVADRKAESVIVYGLHGRKLEYICRTLSKQYHVFSMHVDGIGWAEYCFNSRLSMLCKYDAYFWDTIEAFYIEDEMRIKKIKKKIIKYLHKAKPKMLLTLSLSPARLFDIMLYDAAKECNIPVVLLEHSLMNNAAAGGMTKHLLLGKKYIDFYWCWNQKNRDIYIQHQLTSEEKSFVLGYPLPPQERIVRGGEDELSVLFVGDSLHSDDVEANINFYAVVNEIYQICCKLRIPFKYKGHPTEKTEKKRKYVKEYLSPDITCVDDLFGELRKNQIVVGCRTSALIDAGYIGNYVIQIYYDDKRQKDLVFNHCYLVKDYHNEFAPLLQAIVDKKILPKELSTYEFYQPDDLLLQFNKGLEQVERYYNGKLSNMSTIQ